MSNLAILGYHKIGEAPGGWQTWNYIPEATFVAQLDHLRTSGWQVIDHATFIRGISQPESLPDRAALLTFDDGYRSILDVALSCLLRFGYPAVLFAPTSFVGGVNSFDLDIEPEEKICTWDDLRRLESHGISVQSHGVSHRRFSSISIEERQSELVESRLVLESALGKSIDTFSYPYGDYGGDSLQIQALLKQAGFAAGCLYGGGQNTVPLRNPALLTRLAMGPDTDIAALIEC